MTLWEIAALGCVLAGLTGITWWIVRAEARADRDVAGEIEHMREDARLHRELVDHQQAAHQADIRRLESDIAAIRAGLATAAIPRPDDTPAPSGQTGRATDAPGAMRPPECEERGECPETRA